MTPLPRNYAAQAQAQAHKVRDTRALTFENFFFFKKKSSRSLLPF
jgi:hypothetical protein